MKKNLETISLVLLILSGLLWGSIGVFEFDVVNYLTEPCWFTRLLYFLFGASALYIVFKWQLAKKFRR